VKKETTWQPSGGEFGGDLFCPLCGRTAGPGDWPTHPEFGYRQCPWCLNEGLSVIPAQAPPGEHAEG
jgi:hypothetical protein